MRFLFKNRNALTFYNSLTPAGPGVHFSYLSAPGLQDDTAERQLDYYPRANLSDRFLEDAHRLLDATLERCSRGISPAGFGRWGIGGLQEQVPVS